MRQSSDQPDPLYRSWNHVSLVACFLSRLKKDESTDHDPDLARYRGRGEFRLNWAHEKDTAKGTDLTTLKDVKYGALQLGSTDPVFGEQPNGLRCYNRTLPGDNFSQTGTGVRVSSLQF